MDPVERPSCTELLKYDFFKKDNFAERFAQELKAKITRETADNPLLRSVNGRHESKDETAEERARRKRRKEKVIKYKVPSLNLPVLHPYIEASSCMLKHILLVFFITSLLQNVTARKSVLIFRKPLLAICCCPSVLTKKYWASECLVCARTC